MPDPRLFETELAALHEASFAWALSCCGRERNVAEEVLQEAYLKVLDGRARFEGRSTVKTWFFGVIRMNAHEYRRFFVRRLFRSDEVPAELADSSRGPDSELSMRRRAEVVARALVRLSVRQREVIHLVFYEDLTIAEAAGVMGVALGSARQHYERGKHALASLLGDVEPGRHR